MTNFVSATERKIFGKLGSVGLHDIIQLLGMTKRTATVRLRAGTLHGRLYFREGQILHASGGRFEGEDSIIELLSWTDPEFTIEEGIDTLPKISITTSTDALLLGTLMKLDEGKRGDTTRRIESKRSSFQLKRPLPRRPAPPPPIFERRAVRMLSGMAGLACLPVFWFLLSPRADLTLGWNGQAWSDLPAFDALPLPSREPMNIPDAWAVVPDDVAEQATQPSPEPRRAPVTRARTVAAPGYLTVVVEPWARVEVDGILKGETPLGKLELAAGRHRLVLGNDHIAGVIRDEIEIESGKNVLKRYSFNDVGYLRVVVTPWADVSVDGRAIGQTPMGRLRVPAGVHTIRFHHPNLGDAEREVEITSGETTIVRMQFD